MYDYFKTPRDRYRNDNNFKALVDTMWAHIERCEFTPSEMREAAILASILYQEHNVHRVMLISKEEAEALNVMEQWAHKREQAKPND